MKHRLFPSRHRIARSRLARGCLILCIACALASNSAAQTSWFSSSSYSANRLPSQQPHPSVVRVSAAEHGAMSQGSGTLVASNDNYGLVVTNWHVVRDATGPIEVHFPDGFRSSARVIKVDRDWDLAALLIWKPPASPVPLAATAPRPGDPLTIAGYGSGSYRAMTGRCTQYVAPGFNFPYEMVEVSAEARQGDSGGPILNQRGELAGVLFGAGGGTTSGSYCGRVRDFLASAWGQLPASSTPSGNETLLAEASPAQSSYPHTSLSAAATPPIASRPRTSNAGPPANPQRTDGRISMTREAAANQPSLAAPGIGTPSSTSPSSSPVTSGGSDLFEYGRNVLAIVGAFAIFAKFASLFGQKS